MNQEQGQHGSPTRPSDQPPLEPALTPAAIAQLVQHAIHQTAALQATKTGWKAVKLQQTQLLLDAALKAVQFVVEADPAWDHPDWEILLRKATESGPRYSNGD